jgi:hypothetical protein
MFPNIDKLAKGFLKQAIHSLEEDAKHHDRKARDARSSAAMMKKLLPELLKALKPVKFKPLKPPTKAQLRRMHAGMPFVSPASPARPSAPPVARVG